ncbi:YheC/YheD family protein [Peribacillus sp. SCS-155]|uniref:YheC/YheD family endospore coat-associated protein n=1 Tax=Peribacillus sedimenti TaxID=3115297 RepID=UPI0039065401
MRNDYDRILIIQEENLEETTPAIIIETSLLDKWNLKERDRVSLSIGTVTVFLLVRSVVSDRPLCKITPNTAARLFLPCLDYHIQVRYNHSKREIFIGPFLSALTDHPFDAAAGFGSMDIFFQEMSSLSRDKGLPFFVHRLGRINEGKSLKGYWLFGNDWILIDSPIPEVIYNRLHSRKKENSTTFQEYIEELKKLSVLFFNGSFLSKLDVHTSLVKNDKLLPYLPETIPFADEESFTAFLRNFPVVYVKPSYGSQGKNICKMTRTAEGWILEHSGNMLDSRIFETEEELFYTLDRNIKKRSFIVQKGIPLLEFDHKKIDFRVLLIKNKNHQWRIISVVARIGNAGHIVSNLAQGAEMRNGKEFLYSIVQPEEGKRLYKSIGRLALASAESLTQNKEGLFGELGVDIALDTDKTPWLIEINSKPSKAFLGNYDKFRPSVKSIIDYMHALYRDKETIMHSGNKRD